MHAVKLVWFYLCLVAVPQVISSIRVNTTSSDGKVFISGDHNEVVVSTAARESKNALAEIKSKLESLDKKYEEFSTRLSGLERKIDNYALLFTRKGTSDYVITRGMPNLKAVTFCLWMKSADKGNSGTPLSYAVSAAHNELLLFDYRNLRIVVGNSWSVPLLYLQTTENGTTSAQYGKILWDHGRSTKMARLQLLAKVLKQDT